MPPSVVIYGGSLMGVGDGATVYIDGGVSHAGGSHTFENIIFWGYEQGFWADQAARVKFSNCGFKSTATSGTDVCGLFMSRSFWFRFESCTFHNTDGSAGPGALPAIIMRAESGENAQNCGLMSFHWCVWAGGAIQYDIDVVPPEDVGNLQFYECFTEGAEDPWITFTENTGSSTTYSIVRMRWEQCEIADSGESDVPYISMNASHATLRHPVFVNASNPGWTLVKVTNGTVRGAYINSHTGYVRTSTGTPQGQAVRFKNNGMLISGTSEVPTQTDVEGGSGPAISLAKTADKWSSVGMEPGTGTGSGLFFGAGGTGADPGWDTNLYRNAANELKTDDAFTTALALTAGKALVQKPVDLADSSPVAVDVSLGNIFVLRTGSTLTISAPTNATAGQIIHFVWSGNGTMALTWDAAYHMAGAWTDPANGKYRTISFVYVSIPGVGGRWVEIARAAADIT